MACTVAAGRGAGARARVGELVAAGTAPGEIVVLLRAMTDVRVYERALSSTACRRM